MVREAARRHRAVRARQAPRRDPADRAARIRRLAGRAARIHLARPLHFPADQGRDPALAVDPNSSAGWSTPSRRQGHRAARRAREFTATEESLLGRLAEAVIGALAEIWEEVVPIRHHSRPRDQYRLRRPRRARRGGRGDAFRGRALGRPGRRAIEFLYPSPPCARSSRSSPPRPPTKPAAQRRMAGAARRRRRRSPRRRAHRARAARAFASELMQLRPAT